MQDDVALLARARQLDPEALAEIHDRYYPAVFRYIAFRVSDPHSAEDLTSEVFARLIAALRGRTAPHKTLQGWLYRVASHVVMDHHRRGYRARQVELDEALVSDEAGPAETTEQLATGETLRRALRELTEDQQMVIALRFGQELPLQEVAAIMSKTEGAIKQLQARALATLAKRLSKGSEE